MANVVVWHAVLGVTDAVAAQAQRLRDDGHEVVVPDLFEGRTFDTVDEGIAERDRIGFTSLVARAEAAVIDLPSDLVHVGTSLGAAFATIVLARRPGASALVSIQAAIAPHEVGLDRWPAGVRLQLHTSPGDPWCDDAEVAALTTAVPAQLLEHHTYPATGHLFADDRGGSHDAAAAQLLDERVRAFVARR